uniref:ribosomal protein L6 n=1 Tax=Microzonia abyssicola TaxID=217214 RepID=UPI002E763809|nr:ribosomal protein L6 [Syringoderma abyssicola]WBP70359.1 ribosomal protein L6 [Syringoderma abyssicola]
MKTSIYRLPPEIKCFRDKKKICLSGPQGLVVLYLPVDFIQKGSVVRFAKPLNLSESTAFIQATVGVSLSYVTELSIRGIGYRVDRKQKTLFFKLGYSHPIALVVPEVIAVECVKNNVYLRSAHLGLLKNFTTKIRSLRFPDSYKGSGIIYKGEIVLKKEGKKT